MTCFRILGGVFLAFALFGCGKDQTDFDDAAAAEVQAAWDEFKTGALSNQGSVAANRVTNATHAYYDEVRSLALSATRDELLRMSLARQITVLGMRVRIAPDDLRNMSGRDLFVHAVDQGWIGKNNAADEGISGVMINGDHARAIMTKAGQPTSQFCHFIKEDGVWRLDMMQLMKHVNAIFIKMHEESGLTEEEFVTRAVEFASSRRLTLDDWNPR